jgi:predicted metal-dependent hydrolase
LRRARKPSPPGFFPPATAAAAAMWYIRRPMPPLKYLSAYSEQTRAQVAQLIADDKLAAVLRQRYPHMHGIRTDKALYDYVQDLKTEFLRHAEPISKVAFDNKIQVIQHALGLHTSISRVQGSKLKAKHEIRIATVFKAVPLEMLRMIAVHELAHVKEKQHDKAFYKLCCYMEPQYHQYEFDLRLLLTQLEHSGQPVWE